MFSKSCEYALRAVIFIAEQSKQNNKVGVKEISNATNSPEHFTGKILQKLAKQEIITSIKGPYGGFVLTENDAKQISVSQIIQIIDGDEVYNACGLGLSSCNPDNPCPLHNKFASVRKDLKEIVENTSIYDLIQKNNINT